MTTEERRAAGRRINADTADVWFEYGEVLDPYGERVLSDEEHCIGRNFFARDPVERIPVCFCDLDDALRRGLQAKRDEVDREGWRQIVQPTPETEFQLVNGWREAGVPPPPQPAIIDDAYAIYLCEPVWFTLGQVHGVVRHVSCLPDVDLPLPEPTSQELNVRSWSKGQCSISWFG